MNMIRIDDAATQTEIASEFLKQKEGTAVLTSQGNILRGSSFAFVAALILARRVGQLNYSHCKAIDDIYKRDPIARALAIGSRLYIFVLAQIELKLKFVILSY
jgi:hypothetical protein